MGDISERPRCGVMPVAVPTAEDRAAAIAILRHEITHLRQNFEECALMQNAARGSAEHAESVRSSALWLAAAERLERAAAWLAVE